MDVAGGVGGGGAGGSAERDAGGGGRSPAAGLCDSDLARRKNLTRRPRRTHGVPRRKRTALRAKRSQIFLRGTPWFFVVSVLDPSSLFTLCSMSVNMAMFHLTYPGARCSF